MVKKSKGFNWGPAATGLSRWTGVRLSVLLHHCGIQSPEQVPHHEQQLFTYIVRQYACVVRVAPRLHSQVSCHVVKMSRSAP